MNAIELAKSFVSILDEIYAAASVTASFDGNPDLVKAGANANELIIPMLSMQGLGAYDRNGGYAGGDITMKNQTVPCGFDRGRMFSVDNMDNIETAGIAFGRLASEFIRTKVVPEEDAYRFACYAGKQGVTKIAGALTSGPLVVEALRAAMTGMDEAGVPPEDRHLCITPTLLGLVEDMDTNKSRSVLSSFASIKKVPQSRFYTAIEQLDGKSEGEKEGGYRKCPLHYEKCAADTVGALKVVVSGAATGEIDLANVTPLADAAYTPAAGDSVLAVVGKDINFMILHKAALIQFQKHVVPKIVTPDANQDADAWKFGYRQVGIADVYENKLAGVYTHHKP